MYGVIDQILIYGEQRNTSTDWLLFWDWLHLISVLNLVIRREE